MKAMSKRAMLGSGAAALMLFSGAALAHPGHLGHELPGSMFAAGFWHPLTGFDHLLAMLAVGMWSALTHHTARQAVWLPVMFLALLFAGAMMGMAGVRLPAVEPVIMVSLLVLGLLVASRKAVQGWAGFALVGIRPVPRPGPRDGAARQRRRAGLRGGFHARHPGCTWPACSRGFASSTGTCGCRGRWAWASPVTARCCSSALGSDQGGVIMIPGEILTEPGQIELNVGRPTLTIAVVNEGDRPIQVGSHYHFAEANNALVFDRELATGYRLNIPAGNAVRFEPGMRRTVELVAVGGERRIFGFQGKVMGALK